MLTKSNPIRSKKLRDSARGEDCTLQISGVCNFNPETTVLAHLPFAPSGMGMKPTDISACFACSDCHDCVDGRIDKPEWLRPFEFAHMMACAMFRTWQRWIELGVITIAGAK